MKKKIIIIIAIIAILIIGAVTWKNINSNKKENQAQELTIFQQAIDNEIKPYEEEKSPEFITNFRNAYSLEIVSVESMDDSNSYQGIVRLTYANVSEKLTDYIISLENAQFDEDKFNKDIAELISSAELVTEECKMYFVKNGEELQPIFTEEIIDKMYGGIYSSYYNMLDTFASQIKGGEQN